MVISEIFHGIFRDILHDLAILGAVMVNSGGDAATAGHPGAAQQQREDHGHGMEEAPGEDSDATSQTL